MLSAAADSTRAGPGDPFAKEDAMTSTPTLDEIVVDWRTSLDAAEDAVRALAACRSSVHFAPAELGEYSHDLVLQRQQVGKLIDQIAHDEHIALRHSLAEPRATNRLLGLPTTAKGCVFDLDGVLTASAEIHAAAWKDVLDGFAFRRADLTGHRFAAQPFTMQDYWELIHDRPRLEGLHAYLSSRGIVLPRGLPDDHPGRDTVHGLANWKKHALEIRLAHDPVNVLGGSRRYLECAREAGLHRAVVSPSTSTTAILERADLLALVEACVDGRVMERQGLESKPAPDTTLAACALLDLSPNRVASFETTLAGVEAAKLAGVGFVIAVERHGGQALLKQGADRVVTSLGDLIDPSLLRRLTSATPGGWM
jgi:beta-phosphoglucomutase-like phosphatase (HAD superfamily)